MKVVLSSNIEHYRHTAEALQDANYLEKYICSALYSKKPWYYNLTGSLKGWIDGRIEEKIRNEHIISLKNQEIAYKLIRNSKITKKIHKSKIDKFFNDIYDFRSRLKIKKLKNIKYYHYVSSIGYKSALEARKKLNCKIIVDDRAEHKEYLYNILSEEFKRLNVEFKDETFWNIDCRRDYENADYIITPSTFSKHTFIEQGIDKNKLVVIPYGCDTSKFYPLNLPKNDKFRVIYVGSICARKGAHYLIEAFRKIKNNNIELLLIGKVEKELENHMKNITSNINHIEYIPNNELNKYYSSSDVFILPSLSDSFSLATVEAMSAGLPVIISENVGAKDFVNNGENGFIIPIRSVDSIKEKIIYLHENREICREMGKNARETSKCITWKNYKKI